MFVLFLLTSLLATQFAATYHELTVRHAICFEHGELIDIDGSQAAGSAGVDSPQSSENASDLVNPLAGHHQHCLFVSSRGVRSFGATVSPDNTHSQTSSCRFTRQCGVTFATAALYLFAPKHSPPAA